MHLVARCVRGLEPAVSAEILSSRSAVVETVGHRTIGFRTRTALAAPPRTADDVFLFAARLAGIGPHRADLPALAALAEAADLGVLAARRGGGAPPGAFAVSASFLGRRTYNRYDIEDAVGRVLAARTGVAYHPRRHGAPPPPGAEEWRVTLDGTDATLALRLGDRPAHRRAYKTATIPGTLHPPVAAAMARLAGLRPGQRVLDPCCGAGTLLVEAHHVAPGTTLTGYDLDPGAVRAARQNTDGTPVRVRRGDAAALPVPDGAADRVLCNPPWGGQAPARGRLAGHPVRWWRELARVLAPGGAAVVLLPDARDLAHALAHGLAPAYARRLSLAGRHPLLARLDRQG